MRSIVLASVTAFCVAACAGSVEGHVYGTDSEQPVRLSEHGVFLLATSSDVAAALRAVCPANASDWSEKVRSERQRFEQLSNTYSDSARDEFAQRRGSRHWTALVRMMNVYRDSAAGMDGRPPSLPADLIEKLALNRVNTGPDGHYTFGRVAPGKYLLATELRDEYRWIPVEVARGNAVADITPRGTRTSCEIARAL